MFPFLRPTELNLIRRDYADVVQGPEGNRVKMRYREYLTPQDSPQYDDVYKVDRRQPSEQEVVLENVPCIAKVVHHRDIKLLAFGVVEEGDMLFFFLDNVNMAEPVAGKVMVPDTLLIQDALGVEWIPILNPGPLTSYLRMLVQDMGTAQVLAARLKK